MPEKFGYCKVVNYICSVIGVNAQNVDAFYKESGVRKGSV